MVSVTRRIDSWPASAPVPLYNRLGGSPHKTNPPLLGDAGGSFVSLEGDGGGFCPGRLCFLHAGLPLELHVILTAFRAHIPAPRLYYTPTPVQAGGESERHTQAATSRRRGRVHPVKTSSVGPVFRRRPARPRLFFRGRGRLGGAWLRIQNTQRQRGEEPEAQTSWGGRTFLLQRKGDTVHRRFLAAAR
ncbi:hypothetical protein LX36DRAFT_452192 [Colletotrichum falcatum]|nr:hypothetical protein LX36DRAFT_452192 [Colletotrichum falcatum]